MDPQHDFEITTTLPANVVVRYTVNSAWPGITINAINCEGADLTDYEPIRRWAKKIIEDGRAEIRERNRRM